MFLRNGTWRQTFGWWCSRWSCACCCSSSKPWSTACSRSSRGHRRTNAAGACVPTTGESERSAQTRRSCAGPSTWSSVKSTRVPSPTHPNGLPSCNSPSTRTEPWEPGSSPLRICPTSHAGKTTRALSPCSSPEITNLLQKVYIYIYIYIYSNSITYFYL